MIVEMPPRHGKSSLTSHRFPAWYLGHFPHNEFMLASYEADFAAQWGRKARDVLEEWGGELFGVKVRTDSSAANRWQIEGHDGGMQTAGVGGALTGKGANVLVIDDPVKNAMEADSLHQREKVWDWYLSTAYTRLNPGGSVVIVQTRWHADDLAGRVQENEPGKWKVIKLPALAEEGDLLGREVGEALWPERYPLEALLQMRETQGSYWWASLYQQSPVVRKGGIFDRGWFGFLDAVPSDCQMVRWWDLASTTERESSDPDWTVGVKLGKTPEGLYIVADVVRLRGTPGEVKATIRNTAELDGKTVRIVIAQDPGAAGKIVVREYASMLDGFNARGEKESGDKTIRADPFSAQAEAGNVKLLRAPWNEVYVQELESFPHGGHDDMVDASSGAYSVLSVPKRKLHVRT